MSANLPLYKRQPHVTDRAATLLYMACRAFELAGLRHRLASVYRLECDCCTQKAATHMKMPMAHLPFAPTARTFSLHCCETGKVRRLMILCKHCARRTRAGQQFYKGQPLKHVAHIPTKAPN